MEIYTIKVRIRKSKRFIANLQKYILNVRAKAGISYSYFLCLPGWLGNGHLNNIKGFRLHFPINNLILNEMTSFPMLWFQSICAQLLDQEFTEVRQLH